MALGSINNYIPDGLKLTTYDPHRPEWASNTPEQDSALDRNFYGFFIERGVKGPDKKLVVITGGDDSQEQTASRMVHHLVMELLSDSQLSRKLLRAFSFFVFPLHSQQGTRDGFSRFQYDGPYDNQANGGSLVGDRVRELAIEHWLEDHPLPESGFWGEIAWHCDNLNQLHITKKYTFDGVTWSGDPDVPVSPYAFVSLGTTDSLQAQVDRFIGNTNTGYSAKGWSEIVKPTQIVAGPQSSIDNEMPWRHAGSKASFFYEEDALQQTAVAYLEGLAVLVGAATLLEPDPVIGVNFGVNVTFGHRRGVQPVSIGMGVGVSTSLTHHIAVSSLVGAGLGMQVSLTRRHQLNTSFGVSFGTVSEFGGTKLVYPEIGLSIGVSSDLTRRRSISPQPAVALGLGLSPSLTHHIAVNVELATGLGLQTSLIRRHQISPSVGVGFGVRSSFGSTKPIYDAAMGVSLGVFTSLRRRHQVSVSPSVLFGTSTSFTKIKQLSALASVGFGFHGTLTRGNLESFTVTEVSGPTLTLVGSRGTILHIQATIFRQA